MTTRHTLRQYTAIAFLALLTPTIGLAQVVERDISVTGPRGNTIERRIRTERVGNVIDRQIDIRRPGGTYHRETEIIAPRGYYGGGPRPGPVFYGGPRFIAAPVIATPGLSFFFGTAPPPPPPIYVAPPPPVYVTAPQPAPVPLDAVSIEMDNLQSLHSNHRRDAAIALGKYGDARAVTALIDRLKHDHEKEVRQAAAWALAEIGDSRAIIPLEAAAQFDKKPEVRAVAAKSLARMPSEPLVPGETAVSVPRTRAPIASRPMNAGSTIRSTPLDEDDVPLTSGPTKRSFPSNDEDVPPPDPTPSPRADPESGFGYPRTSR